MPLPDGKPKQLVAAVAAKLHAGEYFDAARLVGAWLGEVEGKPPSPMETKAQADEALTLLLHWCLENDGYEDAALMLWGPTQFDPAPSSANGVERFATKPFFLLMGAGSVSKSFPPPSEFSRMGAGPGIHYRQSSRPEEDHLESNLFTHLVSLQRGSTIPLLAILESFSSASTRASENRACPASSFRSARKPQAGCKVLSDFRGRSRIRNLGSSAGSSFSWMKSRTCPRVCGRTLKILSRTPAATAD
jgi:hypothetical protein